MYESRGDLSALSAFTFKSAYTLSYIDDKRQWIVQKLVRKRVF